MRFAKAVRTGIVNLIVFASLVLVIEGSIRWFYPEIPPQFSERKLFDPHKYGRTYGYKPLATGDELGALVLTDEHGFRTRSRPAQHNTSEQVLVLGDSVSVGVGVEVEQTYSFLLEEKLGKQVINASVTGYGITDYVEVLAHITNNFKPELVIIGICLNDVAATSKARIVTLARKKKADGELAPEERRYPNTLVRTARYINDNYFNFHTFLGSYSRTYVFVKSLATDSSRDHFLAERLDYHDPKTIEFLSSQFAKLKALLTDKTDLVVVIFPYEYQLRTGLLKDLEPQEVIKEAGRRAGVRTYDLYDELMEYLKANRLSSTSIYIFNDPLHFNSVGHHAIAELVYRRVNQS